MIHLDQTLSPESVDVLYDLAHSNALALRCAVPVRERFQRKGEGVQVPRGVGNRSLPGGAGDLHPHHAGDPIPEVEAADQRSVVDHLVVIGGHHDVESLGQQCVDARAQRHVGVVTADRVDVKIGRDPTGCRQHPLRDVDLQGEGLSGSHREVCAVNPVLRSPCCVDLVVTRRERDLLRVPRNSGQGYLVSDQRVRHPPLPDTESQQVVAQPRARRGSRPHDHQAHRVSLGQAHPARRSHRQWIQGDLGFSHQEGALERAGAGGDGAQAVVAAGNPKREAAVRRRSHLGHGRSVVAVDVQPRRRVVDPSRDPRRVAPNLVGDRCDIRSVSHPELSLVEEGVADPYVHEQSLCQLEHSRSVRTAEPAGLGEEPQQREIGAVDGEVGKLLALTVRADPPGGGEAESIGNPGLESVAADPHVEVRRDDRPDHLEEIVGIHLGVRESHRRLGVFGGDGEGTERAIPVERDLSHHSHPGAIFHPSKLGSNLECVRVHEIQGVGRGERPSLEDGLRDDARLPAPDLRRDLAGRGDLLLGRIQQWLDNVELIVVAVAVAQVDQEAAPRREDRLVGGVGDHRAEGSVSEGPVADSADRIRATQEQAGRVGLGDAHGMEPGLSGEGGRRCQRQAEECGCDETTESVRRFHSAGIYPTASGLW